MATKKKEVNEEVKAEEVKNTAAEETSEAANETAKEAEAAETKAAAPKKTSRKKATEAKEAASEEKAADEVTEAESNKSETEVEAKPKRATPRGGWKKAIPKEGEIEDIIKTKTDRYSFSTEIANADRRKELMSSEHVVTETGHEEVKTIATIQMEEFQELAGSASSDRILEGEIIGVRLADPEVENDAGSKETTTVLADILYKKGFVRVSIPSYLLFNYNEDSYKGREGMMALKESIKHRLGSTVSFVASYVNQATMECYADRLKALSMRGTRQYLKPWHGPNSEPNMKAGYLAKSRITCVERNAVIVDALGAEIRVPKDELSYVHIGDAREHFSIDEYVNVKVLTVDQETIVRGNNKYTLVKATGSIKQAYPDIRKRYFDQYPIGKIAPAVITQIRDDGNIYCLLSGGQIDCMCAYPKRGESPRVGQKQMVRINDRNEEDLHLYGMFVSS